MLNLIRRISGSVIPRLDRPWRDDATSNAPQIGRKRRNSSVDRDDDVDDERAAKRARSELQSREPSEAPLGSPAPETQEVREVTTGVHQIELQDGTPAPENVPLPEEPADVPLPEDTADDFDEAGTPPPQTQTEAETQIEAEKEDAPTSEPAQKSEEEGGEAIVVEAENATEGKNDEAEKAAESAPANTQEVETQEDEEKEPEPVEAVQPADAAKKTVGELPELAVTISSQSKEILEAATL
ncbi:hypothetical protein BD626DRAFT_534915 [Schizophyllum amplum]|uniref:Uncharacterized protein n=1 Tax=Schizophyllum amplum TaxID=97359 RepID=A0A550CPW3_9AGAR|nr:hypothetical protein BD626DRAFT_534915 [Auriculariopsis ampla]